MEVSLVVKALLVVNVLQDLEVEKLNILACCCRIPPKSDKRASWEI